jgi:hypothetical protein
MAIHSVSYLLLRNQQVEFKEKIQEYLLKAEALANVALNKELIDQNQTIIYHYLWTLCDVINNAKYINEQALNILLKNS